MNSSMVSPSLCLILWISTGSLTYFFCCMKYAKKAALRSLYPSMLSGGSHSNHTLAAPFRVFTLLGIRVFRKLFELRIRGCNRSTSSHIQGTDKSSSSVGLCLFYLDFQCSPSLVPLSDTRDDGDSLSLPFFLITRAVSSLACEGGFYYGNDFRSFARPVRFSCAGDFTVGNCAAAPPKSAAAPPEYAAAPPESAAAAKEDKVKKIMFSMCVWI
ncbi:hypothetical protein Tco_1219942 [Tanacetum coccineum]